MKPRRNIPLSDDLPGDAMTIKLQPGRPVTTPPRWPSTIRLSRSTCIARGDSQGSCLAWGKRKAGLGMLSLALEYDCQNT